MPGCQLNVIRLLHNQGQIDVEYFRPLGFSGEGPVSRLGTI